MRYSFDPNGVSGTLVLNLGLEDAASGKLMNGASISRRDYRVGLASVQFVASQSQCMRLSGITTAATGVTVSFWFRSSSTSDDTRIFEFSTLTGRENVFVSITGDGFLRFRVADGSSSGQLAYVMSGISVNDNIWRHVVWTISLDGTWMVYVNGVHMWTNAGLYPKSLDYDNSLLGRGAADSEHTLNGAMDEFRLSSVAITDYDVKELYLAGAIYV